MEGVRILKPAMYNHPRRYFSPRALHFPKLPSTTLRVRSDTSVHRVSCLH